jgi:NADH dehydrogenase
MRGRFRLMQERSRHRAQTGAGGDAPLHRVVIVGGGFGGLPAARFLGHLPVEVTLVDRRNHHLFQPLLYQVATGMLSPGEIGPPLRHLVRRLPRVRVELAEVTGFDLERRVVHATRPPNESIELPYDSLIVAAGAGQSYFGHDEFALSAPGMKTIDDALEIRRRVFGAFEMAETAADATDRKEWLTIVIVGAGPTGVELAGQVRELATRSLRDEFRNCDPTAVRVILVDAGKEPLATFGDDLSESAQRELGRLGVELLMNARVIGVDPFGVDVEIGDGKERIAARTVLWAAGVHASPLAQMLADASGAKVDRAGRITPERDLTLPGHPEVFVVGDMVAYDNLPGVAEVALQGGLHSAHRISRRLRGDDRSVPFHYRDVGSVATIGRFNAIFSWRKLHASGLPAWLVWVGVHLAFLNGFANRFLTLMSWVRSMGGRARTERVFSVGHTGGDLSAPAEVLSRIRPNAFPAAERTMGPGAPSSS